MCVGSAAWLGTRHELYSTRVAWRGVMHAQVEAEASTEAAPLPGFTPRKGVGLALFGRSDSRPPSRPGMRIDFQFDRAAFTFKFLPFTVPYPVPFKLLGDETKVRCAALSGRRAGGWQQRGRDAGHAQARRRVRRLPACLAFADLVKWS